MFCLVVGYALALPQAVGWAGIWQNGMWTSADDDMDNIPGTENTHLNSIFEPKKYSSIFLRNTRFLHTFMLYIYIYIRDGADLMFYLGRP